MILLLIFSVQTIDITTIHIFVRARILITGLTDMLSKRINDDEVASGSKAIIDIANGFAVFLRVTSGGPLPNNVLIPFQSIINQEKFREFINNNMKNNGIFTDDPEVYTSLLDTVLQLPPLVHNKCNIFRA